MWRSAGHPRFSLFEIIVAGSRRFVKFFVKSGSVQGPFIRFPPAASSFSPGFTKWEKSGTLSCNLGFVSEGSGVYERLWAPAKAMDPDCCRAAGLIDAGLGPLRAGLAVESVLKQAPGPGQGRLFRPAFGYHNMGPLPPH